MSPPTLVTAALCALIAVIVTFMVIKVSLALVRLAGRLRRKTNLPHEPGHCARLALRENNTSVQIWLAAWLAGSASAITSLMLTATLTEEWPLWRSMVVFGALACSLVASHLVLWRLLKRAKEYRDHILKQRGIAARLSAIAGDHYRLFHDVHVSDSESRRVDHVLIGVQGAFAIIFVTTPKRATTASIRDQHIVAGDQRIDLEPLASTIKRLQHALSKPLGRMIRLRPVICTDLAVKPGEHDNMLITGTSDIVMLQGWRTAEDALMREDFERLAADLTERASD